jgi:hypothetical protein
MRECALALVSSSTASMRFRVKVETMTQPHLALVRHVNLNRFMVDDDIPRVQQTHADHGEPWGTCDYRSSHRWAALVHGR